MFQVIDYSYIGFCSPWGSEWCSENGLRNGACREGGQVPEELVVDLGVWSEVHLCSCRSENV